VVKPGPKVRPAYLSYVVNSTAAHHIDAHTVGAVQQHFNVGSARQIRFRLPPIHEQDRILSVLGTLDDKTDLNRRMNETLEKPVSNEDTYAEGLDPEEVRADVRARRIPSSWIDGVARLDHHRPLTDIPPHRWRQFLSDCNNFLIGDENWAGRAAELGWNTATLFGCRRARPLDHPGGAGLLWAIQGGRLVELHRDWAVIELAANGSRRVFERRRVDAGNVTLPWIEWGRRPGDV
jgi:Type I restriction modification DNA specificity domain